MAAPLVPVQSERRVPPSVRPLLSVCFSVWLSEAAALSPGAFVVSADRTKASERATISECSAKGPSLSSVGLSALE